MGWSGVKLGRIDQNFEGDENGRGHNINYSFKMIVFFFCLIRKRKGE